MSELIRIRSGMRRVLVVALMVVAAFAAFVQDAAANTQTNSPFDFTFTGTVSNICTFPITFSNHLTGVRIKLFDNNGVLVKKIFQVTEQDSFTANGVTLTSNPYNFSWQFGYQDGVLTSEIAYGVAEMFVLPGGSVFVSAGVIDFIAQETGGSITPDPGHTGDIAALCAAFSE
jgi:hypothetical protein